VSHDNRGHSGRPYRRLRALLIGTDADGVLICRAAGCGRIIDRHAVALRDRPSLDMLVPFSRGGDPADPGNYRITHMGCNARRRDRGLDYRGRLGTPASTGGGRQPATNGAAGARRGPAPAPAPRWLSCCPVCPDDLGCDGVSC
jgi:hypothetical protein